MTIITIIVIFAISAFVAPNIVLSLLGACIVLPLSVCIGHFTVEFIDKIGRGLIERTYKFIEIGDKKYTVYNLLKKCSEELSKDGNFAANENERLFIKSDLPFGDKKPTIAVGLNKKESKDTYFLYSKNGQFGLYYKDSKEPMYIFDDECNVHKV